MADRSIADWSYTVSEAVASYSLTGLLGFVVVKKLHLAQWTDRVAWRQVAATIVGAALLFALGAFLGWLVGDPAEAR